MAYGGRKVKLTFLAHSIVSTTDIGNIYNIIGRYSTIVYMSLKNIFINPIMRRKKIHSIMT